MRRALAACAWLVGLGLAGCGSADSEPPVVAEELGPSAAESSMEGIGVTSPPAAAASASSAPAPDPEGAVRFEGVVRVAHPKDKERRMVFAGVTIERSGVDKEGRPEMAVVVQYASDPVWDALDGLRIKAVGVPYDPIGRSIGGEHMHIQEVAVVDPKPENQIIGFGRATTRVGSLTREAGEAGTKSQGSSRLLWTDKGGGRYEVAFTPKREDALAGLVGKPDVSVIAREVQLSKFSAHSGGPFLWITGTP